MALGNLLDSKSSSMNAAYDRALKFDDKRTTGNNCRYGKLADDAFQEAETLESEVKRIEAKIEQISNAKRVRPDSDGFSPWHFSHCWGGGGGRGGNLAIYIILLIMHTKKSMHSQALHLYCSFIILPFLHLCLPL